MHENWQREIEQEASNDLCWDEAMCIDCKHTQTQTHTHCCVTFSQLESFYPKISMSSACSEPNVTSHFRCCSTLPTINVYLRATDTNHSDSTIFRFLSLSFSLALFRSAIAYAFIHKFHATFVFVCVNCFRTICIMCGTLSLCAFTHTFKQTIYCVHNTSVCLWSMYLRCIPANFHCQFFSSSYYNLVSAFYQSIFFY